MTGRTVRTMQYQHQRRNVLPTVLKRLDYAVVARRCVLFTAAGFMGIAVMHLIDGPGSLYYERYIGVLELTIAAASVPFAISLARRPLRDLWSAACALAWLALGFYFASRATGFSRSAVGTRSWGQILGIANLATEVGIVVLAAWALRCRHGE